MSKRLRLLIVEDNAGDVELIVELLPKAGPVLFDLESVAKLSEALARVRDETFDLVLLDLGLPDSQGLATFEKLRDAASSVPVVVLTGNADQDLALAAVKAGAQD
jgi:CheY-like chemotaxis protein